MSIQKHHWKIRSIWSGSKPLCGNRISRISFHRITEWQGWKDLLEVIWSNPPHQPRACCRGPRPGRFWRSPRRDAKTFLGSFYQCSITCTVKKFPDVQMEPPMFQFVLTAPWPGTEYHWVWLCLPYSLLSYTYLKITHPKPSLFVWQTLQLFHLLLDPLLISLQFVCVFLVLGSPCLDTALHKCHSDAAGNALPNAAQMPLAFLAIWAHC